MKFSYQKSPEGQYFPIIPFSVFSKDKVVKLRALVDSGATISMFKPEVAIQLSLPLEKGKEIILSGIGGRIKGYIHNLKLNLGNKNLVMPVVFSYEFAVSFNLLGREGMFKNFKILFDEKNLSLSLN